MEFHDAVAEFLSYLQYEKGSAELTLVSYQSDFRGVAAFLEEQGIPLKVEDVTTAVVRRYVTAMSKSGYARSTIGRRVASLRSLFKYLHQCEYLTRNPIAAVATPKTEEKLPVYLSPEECQRLLDATDANHFFLLAFRDKAALGTLIYTGIRRSELLNLKLRDLDFDSNILTVRNGKGGKGRAIPMCDRLVELLEDWLELRPRCAHDAVFTARTGEPFGRHGLYEAFRRAQQVAGIERQGVTLHTLRHSFATNLLRSGADLVALQRLLGHSSLDTTAIYLHVEMDGLREAVSRHPLQANASCSQLGEDPLTGNHSAP